MQTRIEKIIYPGKSLARLDGKVVLTDEGLPGELVDIRFVKEKSNYSEAQTVRVIEPATSRVEPRCDHYRICSVYQYIDYQTQIQIKQHQVEEFFSHQIKQPLHNFLVRQSPVIWGYRNKIQLHVRWSDDFPKHPFFAYHMLEDYQQYQRISRCFLVPDTINSVLDVVLHTIDEYTLTFIEEVMVLQSSYNQELLLVLYVSSKENETRLKQHIKKYGLESPVSGIICAVKNNKQEITTETLLDGKQTLQEKVGAVFYTRGPHSFFQINVALLHLVIEDMKQCLQFQGTERIADVYCGVGLFGLSCAANASHVFCIESAQDNIKYMNQNIAMNNFQNVTVCAGTSDAWIGRILDQHIDIVIVDPPRRGLSEALCHTVLRKKPGRVIYLSCNPSTLARDLKVLLKVYTIQQVMMYDFFPQTPHIEVCVLLAKK